MRVNEYAILRDAIERGIEIGWMNGHEDGDNPVQIKQRMADSVMDLICEVFLFPDGCDE